MTYGLTAVGYEDPDLYQAVCDRALQLLPDMVPADVALVMWSVGEQGFWHSPFLSGVLGGEEEGLQVAGSPCTSALLLTLLSAAGTAA
jgi:hypothetical protein